MLMIVLQNNFFFAIWPKLLTVLGKKVWKNKNYNSFSLYTPTFFMLSFRQRAAMQIIDLAFGRNKVEEESEW